MQRRIFILSLVLVFTASLLLPVMVSAEVSAGIQVGYGNQSYGSVLGSKVEKNSEWTATLWGNIKHEDLLFTGLYQGGLGLKGVKINRNVAQVAANYRILDEDIFQIYGGLAYQYLNNSFENEQIEGKVPSSLTGHGFAGQVIVDFAITEEIQATANITGSPWNKWSFSQSGITDKNLPSGSIFSYKFDVVYEFDNRLGVQLGISGGSYSAPAFSNKSFPDKGKTSASYRGISLGVTQRF